MYTYHKLLNFKSSVMINFLNFHQGEVIGNFQIESIFRLIITPYFKYKVMKTCNHSELVAYHFVNTTPPLNHFLLKRNC